MINLKQMLNSVIGRTFIYLVIFITGSALHELLFRLMDLPVRSDSTTVLFYSMLVGFILVGALFACERHARSRVTSAVTLLILGFIALRVGRTVVPDPYLLLAALGVAAVGAQTVLHRKLASIQQTVLYCLLTILVSSVIVFALGYGMLVLDGIAVQQQYWK